MSYAIIGATGNTGGRVVEGLLAQGKEVRAIARTAAKLARVEFTSSSKGIDAEPPSLTHSTKAAISAAWPLS